MYSMRLPDPGSSCIGCTFGYHSGFFSLVEAGSQDGYSPKDLNAQQTLVCTLGYFGDSTFQPLQVCREKSPESFPRHWPGHKLQVGPHTVGVTSSRDGEARAPNCRPWFLLEGSKSEPWAALLRSSVSWNVDLTPNSQPLPPLPAFPSQESLPDPEPTVAPEVFTVGSKTFSWTPFPPALGVSGNSYRLFHGTGGSLESPTPPLRACPAPDSTQTPGTQECVSVHSPPALLSCPLCQKAFDPTLAQMDVDSHLAQCLAESTEDVVW
ncbi:hypothetical protein H671_2g7224 [Cricetulus griseus]|nr:hypothetical protein H671_2g7224 [Cricetulus griseus]